MINKEATDRLELIFAIADNDEPKQANGEDEATFPKIMRLATEALASFKEQPPASEFTTKIRKRWLAEAPYQDSTLDYAICAVIDLCDRLDVSEAENKELKEIILTAPGNDEEDFLSKHRTWWDLHYRELRSPGCNLPRSTFKQLKAKLDASEASRKELVEDLLRIDNYCRVNDIDIDAAIEKSKQISKE